MQPLFSLYANGKLIQQGYNLKLISEHIEKICGNCIIDDKIIPEFKITNVNEVRIDRNNTII